MKKTFLAAIIASTSLATAAHAEEPRASIFGAFGQADHEIVGVSESDTSIALGATYKFNPNFEAEFRYDDFGTAEFGYSVEGSMSALSLGIKGIIPAGDQFGFYGKFGFASWDFDGKAGYESGSESGTDFYFGLGAQVFANDNVAFGLDYTMLTAEGEDNTDYEISNISLFLNYYF